MPYLACSLVAGYSGHKFMLMRVVVVQVHVSLAGTVLIDGDPVVGGMPRPVGACRLGSSCAFKEGEYHGKDSESCDAQPGERLLAHCAAYSLSHVTPPF